MPSHAERDRIDPFGDSIDVLLKEEAEHPNALFLGRITWNATREILYRVHDPKMANRVLQGVIDTKAYPREFDYRMEADRDWEFASWHLGICHGE